MSNQGKLYLVPTPIGMNSIISEAVKAIVCETRHFIVESEKESRRFLKQCGYDLKNNYPDFYIVNEHNANDSFVEYLNPIKLGLNMVLMSDAGIPCVADPGSKIVKLCHQKLIDIIPMQGSSSILMALMASGLNGQQFNFHGYLPSEKGQRIDSLKKLQNEILKHGNSHIFIETPYRNNAMFQDILSNVTSSINLCIALNIEGENQLIKTQSISQWQKSSLVLEKEPAIFILGK